MGEKNNNVVNSVRAVKRLIFQVDYITTSNYCSKFTISVLKG